MYVCKICQEPVHRKDDLVVIIRYENDIEGITVHKGQCDDALRATVHKQGGSSSTTVDLRCFETDEDLDCFLENVQQPPGRYKFIIS